MKKKPPSILIIDDEQDNLVLISKMLEKSFSKISIYSASSGFAGLKLAKKYLPDTIILDLLMPEIDGFLVCKKLKKNNLTRHIPIIIITGSEDQMNTKIKVLEIGADAFLSKPIRKSELIAQIKVMLRIKLAEDKIRREKKNLEKKIKQRTEKLHLLAAHTLSLQEGERIRISRELHDELGQMLVGLQMGHDSLLKILTKNNITNLNKNKIIIKIKDLTNITEQSFESIRRIIHDLRPPVLDHLGLISAIKWLACDFHKKSNIQIIVNNTIDKEISYSNEKRTTIFRILQEGFTNIAKHSKATKVVIDIKYDNDNNDTDMIFTIEDNGCGFDIRDIESSKNFGILGMRERASQCNWQLSIEGQKGIGTRVILKTKT